MYVIWPPTVSVRESAPFCSMGDGRQLGLSLMLREMALVAAVTPAVRRDPRHQPGELYAGTRAIGAPRAGATVTRLRRRSLRHGHQRHLGSPCAGVDRGHSGDPTRSGVSPPHRDSSALAGKAAALRDTPAIRPHCIAPSIHGGEPAALHGKPPGDRAAHSGQARLAPGGGAELLEKVMTAQGAARDPLAFLALSLDAAGRPIPVVNTDPATDLFLDMRYTPGLEGGMKSEAVLRPFPVGPVRLDWGRWWPTTLTLRTGLGALRGDTYHSPRVVWGREVNLLLLGLANQIAGGTVDPRSFAIPDSSLPAPCAAAWRR